MGVGWGACTQAGYLVMVSKRKLDQSADLTLWQGLHSSATSTAWASIKGALDCMTRDLLGRSSLLLLVPN